MVELLPSFVLLLNVALTTPSQDMLLEPRSVIRNAPLCQNVELVRNLVDAVNALS